MRRRDFTKLALAGAAASIAAPAVVKAQTTFNWKMTSFYGPNAYFYSTGPGSAKDLVKRIDDMSGGRIKIQFYGAGELIPANAGFDAVSSGTVEMNYANSYFWTGKSFAAQYFCAVPFGMNFVGLNGWMYDGGGLELWREVYDKFNLVPFLVRQYRRADDRLVPQADREGRRPQGPEDAHPRPCRPRLSRTRRRRAGAGARRHLPGARARRDRCRRIRRPLSRPPARPAEGRQILLHHRLARDRDRRANSSSTRRPGRRCRPTCKAIVENACMACNDRGEAWCQKVNAEAMDDLVKNQGVIAQPLPDSVVAALRAANAKILADAVAKDPVTKKVHELVYELHGDLQEVGELQRGRLLRQDPRQGLT